MKEKESQHFSDNRRNFLKKTEKGMGIALGASLINTLPVNLASAESSNSSNLAYPFTLGIASGDPLPDGVVLWTRLAPDPLNGGGMPDRAVDVAWQVAEDPRFRRIVRQGTGQALPALGHSVHVDVRGLRPHREYWYRF